MRVLGVLDLLDGRAVHARAGAREHYEPVRAIAGDSIEPGDARALARAYLDRFDLTELYVADLDAVMGGAAQDRLVTALAGLGALWLDAGISSADRARRALTLGAARVIVGLETLRSWEALREICDAVGGARVAFSLDLCDGEPLARGGIPLGDSPHVMAKRAADAGVQSIIVIDVKKVGTSGGLDLEVIARVREVAPRVTLLAGGGVRSIDDIRCLADVGCDGVLVATALQNGRLSAEDVAAALKNSSIREE